MTGPSHLAADQVEHFREHGYLAPLRVLSETEAAGVAVHVEVLMRKTSDLAVPGARHKPHLYAKWASDLVRHPCVLDAVEDLIGPNLLVWRSVFFVKPARDPRYVAWHQDSAYWGLSAEDVVTAWIALTDSTRENGCLRVVPGSHRRPEVPHTIHFAENNLLVRGQSAAVDIPDDQARDLELRRGEMSLHHVRMLHASGDNRSPGPRLGLAVRYIATHVRQRGLRQGATLVRGIDTFGHFDHEPEPRRDEDPVALDWHRRSRRRYAVEVLWETVTRSSPRNLLGATRLLAGPSRLYLALRSLRHGAWR